MPGVPPDALAQVKKGLRGLFKNRKQKGQQQSQPEASSTSHGPTSTVTMTAAAPAAAPRTTEDANTKDESFPPPPPGPPPATSAEPTAPQSSEAGHHISEPTKLEEAKAVDLNPASDGKAVPSTGMSATSGPMGDHMAEVFQDTEPAVEGGDTRV